jgi:protein involved in polysaccharide export with SLBB domain
VTKRMLVSVVLFLWALLGYAQNVGSTVVESSVTQFLSAYKLGAGDVISVRVLGEDDLSVEKIRLTDTGTIFMPNLGELAVRGRTLGEVERMVVEGLKGRILVNPRVSVTVEEYRPFFINGMVDKPGGYQFQPGLTVRKAASLAGGFKDRASLSKLFVIRGDDPQQRQFKVDLNAPVYPGDIVTVEESFF